MPKKLFLIYGLSIVLLLFGVAYIAVHTRGLDGALITHYDLMRGIVFLGSRTDFYAIMFGGFLITALNVLMSFLLYVRIRFLSYLIAWITVVFNVLIVLSVMYLLALNV